VPPQATDDHDLSELHAMAQRLGLKRAWFQDKPGTPHYDLTPTKRTQAIKLGAQATSSKASSYQQKRGKIPEL
jgi:hypothetical protein